MTAVDKPPATVPPEAVEAAAEAIYNTSLWDGRPSEHQLDWESLPPTFADGIRRKARAALTAAAVDLIAANTADTKADAWDEGQHAGWDAHWRSVNPDKSDGPTRPVNPYRAAVLRTDTTHKETP